MMSRAGLLYIRLMPALVFALLLFVLLVPTRAHAYAQAYYQAYYQSGYTSPSVTTSSTTLITPTTARINGVLSSGTDGSQHGFAYSTSPTISSSVTTTTLGTYTVPRSFFSDLSSLTAGVTYYYRAYATNPSTTSYGTIKFFSYQAVSGRIIRLAGGTRLENVRLY